jgi:DNA-binding MarR family transcriptional regulator
MSKPITTVKPPHDPAIRQAAEGFALIAAVLREEATQAGAPVGLSAAQTRTLALLAQAPSGMRLSEIAGRLGVSSASASDTVAGLVKRKLAIRGSDPDDRRAVRFTAGPQVRRAGGGHGKLPGAGLQESLGDLELSDRTALQRILVRLVLSLQRRGRIQIARACVNCRFFRPGAHPRRALPHHCDYVDKPFADGALRVSCPEFEAADREGALAKQARWLDGEDPRAPGPRRGQTK